MMMKIREKLDSIILFTTIIGSVIGGISYVEDKFALADEVEELAKRLDKSELRQAYKDTLSNLYFYRDQARKYPKDLDLKAKLIEAEEQANDIKQLLKNLEMKQG